MGPQGWSYTDELTTPWALRPKSPAPQFHSQKLGLILEHELASVPAPSSFQGQRVCFLTFSVIPPSPCTAWSQVAVPCPLDGGLQLPLCSLTAPWITSEVLRLAGRWHALGPASKPLA